MGLSGLALSKALRVTAKYPDIGSDTDVHIRAAAIPAQLFRYRCQAQPSPALPPLVYRLAIQQSACEVVIARTMSRKASGGWLRSASMHTSTCPVACEKPLTTAVLRSRTPLRRIKEIGAPLWASLCMIASVPSSLSSSTTIISYVTLQATRVAAMRSTRVVKFSASLYVGSTTDTQGSARSDITVTIAFNVLLSTLAMRSQWQFCSAIQPRQYAGNW